VINNGLNEALRLIRVFHDMPRAEAIERLGISNSYLSEIENGKKPATLELVKKYSQVFNLPVSSIIFFSEKVETGSASEKTRQVLAKKILKMLEWIEDKDSYQDAS
jgi:transcriptional regulator with XRE-family HTH domain